MQNVVSINKGREYIEIINDTNLETTYNEEADRIEIIALIFVSKFFRDTKNNNKNGLDLDFDSKNPENYMVGIKYFNVPEEDMRKIIKVEQIYKRKELDFTLLDENTWEYSEIKGFVENSLENYRNTV